jgi:hypothetical protein
MKYFSTSLQNVLFVFDWHCSLTWLGLGPPRAVFKEQKRPVRAFVVWPKKPLCSCLSLFARLNLLPVFSIYLLECCKFMQRYPDFLQRTDEVHPA